MRPVARCICGTTAPIWRHENQEALTQWVALPHETPLESPCPLGCAEGDVDAATSRAPALILTGSTSAILATDTGAIALAFSPLSNAVLTAVDELGGSAWAVVFELASDETFPDLTLTGGGPRTFGDQSAVITRSSQ